MNTATELCKGFLVYIDTTARATTWAAQEWKEAHFAQLKDGTILRSEVAGPTPHFGKSRGGKAAQWSRVDALPSGAEFIGNYPVPNAA